VVRWQVSGGTGGNPCALLATHKIDAEIAGKSESLNVRLTKAENAIKALADQQSNQTQKLIHDLLAAAKTANNPAVAARALDVVASLTSTLREGKRSASPEFFQTAIENIGALPQRKLSEQLHKTRLVLAEYRSALQSVPEPQNYTTFICERGHDQTFAVPKGDLTSPNRFISDIRVVGCSQALDGTTWKNMVFENARIAYHGGPVVLENVIFLNCTFEVERMDEGNRLLQYAALNQKVLKVKPEVFGQAGV
jgi:hypothetical protein